MKIRKKMIIIMPEMIDRGVAVLAKNLCEKMEIVQIIIAFE